MSRRRRPPMVMVQRKILSLDPTSNPGVVRVCFELYRRVARLRLDQIDIYPGVVGLPKWLDDKIFGGVVAGKRIQTNPDGQGGGA